MSCAFFSQSDVTSILNYTMPYSYEYLTVVTG